LAACQVEIDNQIETGFDLCCVDMTMHKKHYRLICVYRPPGVSQSNKVDCNYLSQCLSNLCVTKHIILAAGDYNLPKIPWDTLTCPIDGAHDVMLDTFVQANLKQINLDSTRVNNVLDLLLTSHIDLIVDMYVDCPIGASDYNVVIFHFPSFSTNPAPCHI